MFTGRASAALRAMCEVYGWHKREVLIPANTCSIVAWAIITSGNIPVLVDTAPGSAHVSGAAFRDMCTSQTAACIVTHLYGIAAENAAPFLPDTVITLHDVAHGLPENGAPAAGHLLLSTGLGKTIDIELGGGMGTNDDAFAREVRGQLDRIPLWSPSLEKRYREWSELYWALHRVEQTHPPVAKLYGTLFDQYRSLVSFRIPDAYWADLPAALTAAPAKRNRRKLAAEQYAAGLSDVPGVVLLPHGTTAQWKFPLLVDAAWRDALLDDLWHSGETDVTCWYPALHRMMEAIVGPGRYSEAPNALDVERRIVNLPLSGGRAENEQRIDRIRKWTG